MTEAVVTALQQYLQQGRDAVVRALDELGEHDARRTLTPSGTNILGLVEHLVGIERSYLGVCVGRAPGSTLPWEEDGSVWDGADMWVRPEESRDHVVGLHHQAWASSDASIAALPLDTEAHETAQHAGHAEILREGLDGQRGRDHDSLGDGAAWTEHLGRIREAAAAETTRWGQCPGTVSPVGCRPERWARTWVADCGRPTAYPWA